MRFGPSGSLAAAAGGKANVYTALCKVIKEYHSWETSPSLHYPPCTLPPPFQVKTTVGTKVKSGKTRQTAAMTSSHTKQAAKFRLRADPESQRLRGSLSSDNRFVSRRRTGRRPTGAGRATHPPPHCSSRPAAVCRAKSSGAGEARVLAAPLPGGIGAAAAV